MLMIAPSVTGLQQLLHKCERELYWLDMAVNYRKSGCMRIGPRNNVKCTNIISLDGKLLPWVSDIKYLGINIVSSKMFKWRAHLFKPNDPSTVLLTAFLGRLEELPLKRLLFNLSRVNVCRYCCMA